MKLIRTIAMTATALVGIGALAGCTPAPPPMTTAGGQPIVELPRDMNVLFWTQPQRDLAFRMFDTVAPARTIRAGGQVMALPHGAPLNPVWEADGRSWTVDSHMADQRLAGLIIIQDGRIRLERYGLGFSGAGRWTSFSVAKSFTSTLVGAAVQDGYITSLDAPVTRYIPELAGSGYDGVTVAQLLAMQSGVRWNEDYTDPNSDVALFNLQQPADGLDPVTAYMRRLPRAHAPGTRWNYNTGETNLIGVLVERATGKALADYLSEKVWQPFGMEADAAWVLNSGGREISGCCMSISLRDYGRFGMFVLGGGRAGDRQIVPQGWFDAAGRKQAEIGRPGAGYGYQWWTFDDGSFSAQGIFGQGIFIDPSRKLVIAGVGNWPTATDPVMAQRRHAFYQAVRAAVDSR
ncbi:serine hydrolase domain-containing protein [Sphingomonas lacunae]|nr:serine hydrolase domain-containing protein [Sphingomonas lacunae]